jgi:acetyl-CoA C-acetyltransferase
MMNAPQGRLQNDPSIVGWGHTRFGKLADMDLEALIVQVTREALANAGLEAKDVDAIFVGVFNGGFSKQDFPSSLVLQADPAFRYTPSTRFENACATGSAAVHGALNFIASGRGRVALVVGAEKMTATAPDVVGDILLGCSYLKEEAKGTGPGFVGVFGTVAKEYFDKYGNHYDALARIAAKNHRNGVDNPYAQLRKDLSFEFCRDESAGNPLVAPPLKRTDCSPVSDGAAALVITSGDVARTMQRAVRFRAAVQVNDFLPIHKRDMTRLEGAAVAWQRGLAMAGAKLDDLDLAECHDCFTIAELMEYEAMGLTPLGQGHRAIDEGWVEKTGKLPVNPSGGLKAKGHPIGATGVSMHAVAAMQVTGAAGEMQIPGASLAGVFNMGGLGVANYVSILERAR